MEAELVDAQRHMSEVLTKFLRVDAVPLIESNVTSNFDNEATAGGSPWPPRKDPSLTHPILNISGRLKAAATGMGSEHIEQINNNELVYGVRGGNEGIPYARRHQLGDIPGSRDALGRAMNIPQREYMAISEDTINELGDMLAEVVAEALVR